MNPVWGRYANLLRDTSIMASAYNYLVIAVKNQAISNEINELDEQGSFIDFMEVLLGVKKKVFAVTEDDRKNIVEEFKKRSSTRTLPNPAVIEIEEDSLTLIKNLFGEDNIEIKE